MRPHSPPRDLPPSHPQQVINGGSGSSVINLDHASVLQQPPSWLEPGVLRPLDLVPPPLSPAGGGNATAAWVVAQTRLFVQLTASYDLADFPFGALPPHRSLRGTLCCVQTYCPTTRDEETRTEPLFCPSLACRGFRGCFRRHAKRRDRNGALRSRSLHGLHCYAQRPALHPDAQPPVLYLSHHRRVFASPSPHPQESFIHPAEEVRWVPVPRVAQTLLPADVGGWRVEGAGALISKQFYPSEQQYYSHLHLYVQIAREPAVYNLRFTLGSALLTIMAFAAVCIRPDEPDRLAISTTAFLGAFRRC